MLNDLMDWEMSFVDKQSRIQKFNHLWMMHPYPGFAPFKKSYS